MTETAFSHTNPSGRWMRVDGLGQMTTDRDPSRVFTRS